MALDRELGKGARMNGWVLVTGASGTLGRVVVRRLLEHGATVRALSRSQRPPLGERHTWVTGDLATGAGIDPALEGVETVVHCATSNGRGDVATTRTLVEAAWRRRPHVVYVSIVGVDRVPLTYYRAKLAAETLVEASGLPWTVQRVTQFHNLVATLTTVQRPLPAVLMPAGVRFQPIDVSDAATRLVGIVDSGPCRRVPDIGGPEVREAVDLARATLRSLGWRRPVLALPAPGRTLRTLREGANLVPDHAVGTVTFEQFLARRAAVA